MLPGNSLKNTCLPALWKHSIWITSVLSFLTAAIYLANQSLIVGELEDEIFVGVLLINSVVTGTFGGHLHSQSVRLFKLLPLEDHKLSVPSRIFGSFQNILFGFGFAIVISGCVFLLSPWEEQSLNLLLSLFIFSVNVQVGMGAGALTMFWTLSRRSVQLMDIRILNLTRPDIIQFLNAISLTVLLVGFLSSAAVLSLLFSKFDMSFAVVAFSFFSLTMVISSYFVPLSPLIQKIKATKSQELNQIEKRIDHGYRLSLKKSEQVEEIDMLLTFRNEIRKVRTLPPNGQFSVFTAASVTFLSFFPTLVDHLLTTFSQ